MFNPIEQTYFIFIHLTNIILSMGEINYLIAHIKDLAKKSSKENILTSTSFLSLSEQSEINKVLPSLNKEYLNELNFILDGGERENSDRKKNSFYCSFIFK